MPDITTERKLEIEDKVNLILRKNKVKPVPSVDISAILKKNKFEIQTADMDINTTGCLIVDDKAKNKLILVNTKFRNEEEESRNEEDLNFKKSRFIAAHEYGHYIMHKKAHESIYAHRDTYHQDDTIELEADYFARAILMPLDIFRSVYEIVIDLSNNDNDFALRTLSRLFRVTKKKIVLRIDDLEELEQ